jgi:FtsP/CotA-like multicopper oxidase with cupredoxin domain
VRVGGIEPDPMEFTAGETYRLRFMHISPDDNKHVSLLKNGEPVAWQYIAKDGADLPPNQVGIISAELDIHVGETYDFLWMPEESGSYTLSIDHLRPRCPGFSARGSGAAQGRG